MKILTVHGLGRQEKNPGTWQGGWQNAFGEAVARWSSTPPVVQHADYDSLFADTPMTVGGTAQGFGALLWDEVKFGIADKVSNLWPFRRRGFGDKVNDVVKWKIGMVTQFAEDPDLRKRLREHLAKQIQQHNPDVVFAHSLGTIITYNLLLNEPHTSLLRNRTYITAGCQIGRAALRSLFGGRLQTVDVGSWFNLYNRHDDVLVVPLNIFAQNYLQVDTHFDIEGVGDHDAIGYILHDNAVNTVWRQLALKPRASVHALGGTQPKATKADVLPVSPSADEPARLNRRALLIGINEYPNPDDRLEGCVNDVFRMSAALQQTGFQPDEIRTVLNERATAAGIRERYAWLMDDPRPGDVRVLFFSGHGAQIPDYGGDETVDHKDETLVAYDFDWNDRSTHLTDDDFNAVYAQLPYETTFIAFFDCCHSGGLTRMGGAKVRGLNPPDDIRHRMLRWNLEDQIWEMRDLGKKRTRGQAVSYMADRPDYVGKENDTNRMFRAAAARQIDAKSYTRRKAKFGHRGPYQPLIFEACEEHDFAYEYRDGVTSYGGYTFFLTQKLFAAAREGKDITFAELNAYAKRLLATQFQQTPNLIGPSVLKNAFVPRGQPKKAERQPAKKRRKKPGKKS